MSERTEVFMRIVVGIVSGIILGVWRVLIQVLSVINAIYTLFTNKRHKGIAELCNYWNTQVYKFLRYMTFNTNERPFPFSDIGKNIESYDSKK